MRHPDYPKTNLAILVKPATLPAPDEGVCLFISPEYALAVFRKLRMDSGLLNYTMHPTFFGTYPKLFGPDFSIVLRGTPLGRNNKSRLLSLKPLDSST
jgi:threonine aldolase